MATSAVPFLLIVYTALQGGGYDSVVRGEVGVAVWWLVLLGAVIGLIPATRLTTAAWVGVGALAAIGVWTALGISWSESPEKSTIEMARVATYLGVFVLALCVQGSDGLRRTAVAVAVAAAVVGALALLSRLHPQWFPRTRPRACSSTPALASITRSIIGTGSPR